MEFIQQAKFKIVPTYNGGYRTILLCPIYNQELKFIDKKIIKCPVCNNLVSKDLYE